MLDATLLAAKAAIRQNKPQLAKQLLNAFIRELDDQKGKAVSQQAYDLLKADALYVIGTMH